ncbi:VCBS repeat-containing protein [Daejeonella sp.]|uniref:VCBS repeat-containing protein n=1 Tax=Daejeonella sp. TaxID=2805397 RepID=UPI003983908B
MKTAAGLCLILCMYLSGYSQEPSLFESLSSSRTGITFKNILPETPQSNILTYEYFYNGGGVAVGDLNNDGLDDIYFTGNMAPNALYINLGNFKFKEIAESAGVDCNTGWKTGVTMADVNYDGYLDIYVCYSGKGDPEKRRNKLFINNGDLTFTDKAAELGLDDPGHSTHASFFDFDRDGDLDMYLLNHNIVVIQEFEFAKAKKTRHPYAGDKLFRNDNGRFVDISEQAGIKGNPLGFGLGVSVSDINKDGWPDMYVSNDYLEPDYLYINNGNGTFTDRMMDYMQHISYFSMGSDVSDINNDEWPDIFTLDMLPEDNERQKLLYGPENYEHYALMVLNGFYFQNMRNMLHLNNGDGTYSEIGQFAGVSKTDWSWAPLFADYDNDGLKDLFITNGYYRDYTNRDFLKYKGDYFFEKGKAKEKADTFHLVSTMTSTPVHNYLYKNNGDLTFSDKSKEWGFKELNFSNGAAYSDLDNDGDLDLVVNNLNATASIYKNFGREKYPGQNYLQLSLKGAGKNSTAIGTKIRIYNQGKVQYFEQIPSRGFQSSVSDRIHIGLGKTDKVDSLKIDWPLGGQKILIDVPVNQIVEIAEENNLIQKDHPMSVAPPVFSKVNPVINYVHVEEGFNDFKRQPLLLTMLTPCGPVMATGDVNNDGRIDVFIGGAQGNPGKLFIQNTQGSFEESPFNAFDKQFTDADALFFDADGDQDADLYIVSGGYNEYGPKDKALQDRLYLNDGTGKFMLSTDGLPEMLVSKSCVSTSDFDHDGDLDLFIGGRVIPGQYPVTPESFLLENKGGRFTKITDAKARELSQIGMVTDAQWLDVDGDGWEDLVVIGEFMAIEVFLNKQGKNLERASKRFFDRPLTGLWNKMIVYDFDQDGDQDIILGNLGLNTQLRASSQEPIELVYKDFDKNGSVDPIMTHYIQGISYPFASRDELLDQMYGMRSKYTSYASYANARLNAIFPASDLKDAGVLKATELTSVYLENRQGKFLSHPLPKAAQFSPIYAMTLIDYNKDGNMDVILAGNQSSIRIRMGVIDANFGQLYEGDGKGNFAYVPQAQSGLSLTGDTKSLQTVTVNGDLFLMVGTNNVGVHTYKLN